jgi:PAS domain S-box-containing protein
MLRQRERRAQQLRQLNGKLAVRAEERVHQLRASRAQIDAIFDNSPDWLTLFRATSDGRFVYEDMNRATEIAYGLSREQVIGRTPEEVLGVEQAQLPLRLMRACIETGQSQRYSAQRLMAGVTRSIDVMFVRVAEWHDGDYRIMATARDVTDQKAAEVTLRSSEEQFRRLVQGVTDYSLYMLAPDGKVASWNAGAQRIKGYAPEEIIGQHFSRFYTEEDRQNGEPERALSTAAREGRFEKEGWRVRKNGERFWANVVIDAIRDEGEIIGFAKITRDITEQRDARIALERTREALYQAQKMEAIGQLTGGIAHDFNNLLTVVIGSLEIASRRVSDETVKRLIGNAMRGAQRGAALTQRMLVFARRQQLDVQPVDIPLLVRGMREMLERSLGPSVLIETRFPLSLPRVKTDPNQLEMALLNLSVNSRDAMPEGGSIVVAARLETVECGRGQLRPGSYVCLSVTDSGEGMDEATLSKAIDPFFTTKEVGKGTGLGLPMVHGLAQESGGDLVLKSRKGEGTTAELWLPIAEKFPVAAAETKAPAPSRGSPKLTVMVVDDDPLVLTNMAAMLEDLGHTVFEAASAHDALAILRREKAIQLVLTDQAMPQMTGLQLIDEIKNGWPDLPVILATGFADLPPDTDPLQITLAKPFLQYDLAQAVVAALEDPKKRRVVRFRTSKP